MSSQVSPRCPPSTRRGCGRRRSDGAATSHGRSRAVELVEHGVDRLRERPLEPLGVRRIRGARVRWLSGEDRVEGPCRPHVVGDDRLAGDARGVQEHRRGDAGAALARRAGHRDGPLRIGDDREQPRGPRPSRSQAGRVDGDEVGRHRPVAVHPGEPSREQRERAHPRARAGQGRAPAPVSDADRGATTSTGATATQPVCGCRRAARHLRTWTPERVGRPAVVAVLPGLGRCRARPSRRRRFRARHIPSIGPAPTLSIDVG